MAKLADYLISGVWLAEIEGKKQVSHVMLHEDTESVFKQGVKTPAEEVIKLLKFNKTIMTIGWDYSSASWVQDSYVTYEKVYFVEYLRTYKNYIVRDDLKDLIDMSAFM